MFNVKKLRYTSDEDYDMREKRLTFSCSQWHWPLELSFNGFLISRK